MIERIDSRLEFLEDLHAASKLPGKFQPQRVAWIPPSERQPPSQWILKQTLMTDQLSPALKNDLIRLQQRLAKNPEF